ncbi:acylphosphatase [Sphingomonas sp. ID0503]|uniref:acylphosphatase n=1 Tax=Sphingomonas sp. ID0503 TaxID=3399691 RepID=UPI003AFA7B6E
MSEGRIARHLVISGRVQGVWFRDWAVETARGAGLDGWVRNRRDGAVEAIVAGPAHAVDMFTERCRQGPSRASVEDLALSDWTEAVESGFTRKPTI